MLGLFPLCSIGVLFWTAQAQIWSVYNVWEVAMDPEGAIVT